MSSSKAFSVGFIPIALIAQPSSLVLMFPPPSTSNSLKAWTFCHQKLIERKGKLVKDTDVWRMGHLFEFSNLFLTQSLFTHGQANQLKSLGLIFRHKPKTKTIEGIWTFDHWLLIHLAHLACIYVFSRGRASNKLFVVFKNALHPLLHLFWFQFLLLLNNPSADVVDAASAACYLFYDQPEAAHVVHWLLW